MRFGGCGRCASFACGHVQHLRRRQNHQFSRVWHVCSPASSSSSSSLISSPPTGVSPNTLCGLTTIAKAHPSTTHGIYVCDSLIHEFIGSRRDQTEEEPRVDRLWSSAGSGDGQRHLSLVRWCGKKCTEHVPWIKTSSYLTHCGRRSAVSGNWSGQ